MKKILLATSALVATGLVASPVLAQQDSQEGSAMMAMSDTTSISIFQEFGYSSNSDNLTEDRSSMWSDGEMTFSFASTSDTGMTYSAHVELEVNPNQAADGIDEASMSLSTPEFGTVTLGANDDVTAAYATYLPGGRNMASNDDWVSNAIDANGDPVGNSLKDSATAANYGDSNKLSYRSPSFGGMSFGGSWSELDDSNAQGAGDTGNSADTSFGAKYATEFGPATVKLSYNNSSNGESTGKSDASSYGVSVGLDAFSFAVSTASHETDADDVTTTAFGAGYKVNDDIQVAASVVTSEDDNSKNSLDTTVLSFSYTIAPGLNFAVAMNQFDYDHSTDNNLDLKSDEVRASIQVNF